jgi:hypothetical protein
MADDVTITFTADVSDLQQGMQQATSAVEATTSALPVAPRRSTAASLRCRKPMGAPRRRISQRCGRRAILNSLSRGKMCKRNMILPQTA